MLPTCHVKKSHKNDKRYKDGVQDRNRRITREEVTKESRTRGQDLVPSGKESQGEQVAERPGAHRLSWRLNVRIHHRQGAVRGGLTHTHSLSGRIRTLPENNLGNCLPWFQRPYSWDIILRTQPSKKKGMGMPKMC